VTEGGGCECRVESSGSVSELGFGRILWNDLGNRKWTESGSG
jgi:hypothetical protein